MTIESQSVIHLKCASTPNNSLAHTNKIYYNPNQFNDKKVHYISIYGKEHELVYSAEAHPDVEQGSIALNRIHRNDLKLSLMKLIECSIFIPPEQDFYIDECTIEIDFLQSFGSSQTKIDGLELESHIKQIYNEQIFTVGQKFAFQFEGSTFTGAFTEITNCETSDWVKGDRSKVEELVTRGKLYNNSNIRFSKPKGSLIQFENVSTPGKSNNILKSGASFQKMGIGGLDIQLGKMFRRAFASRIYPQEIIKKLGVKHIKGILLYGPPGCGKTLMARQIGKLLNAKDPKIVNGPEILNKYVGESEANIRNLFADAEQEYAEKGDESDLHLIIFDEIDAICKQRGTVNSGTGVNDSIVNQLLSKIDGVNPLNNVLLIGMTNRMDLIDEALLRPGRFEVQTEIGLPDEQGRVQILNIHTSSMKDNGALGNDVNIDELANRTKNFSGAELEGLVKSASSFALNRNIDLEHLENIPKDLGDNIKVTKHDFERALEEVKPAFGVSTDDLELYTSQGIIDYGPRFSKLKATCQSFVNQVRVSKRTGLLTVLLEGIQGTGKTCFAATIAKESEFPYLKIVSPQTMVGYSEAMKCNKLTKAFDDAYKSPLSIIVLDDIERLVDYVNIGPRFSNSVLQTLLVLIKKPPPKGRKLLVIGTTSRSSILETLEILDAFNIVTNVPTLDTNSDIENVLKSCDTFDENKDIIPSLLPLIPKGISIKKLLLVVEMAGTRVDEGATLTTELFRESLLDCGVTPEVDF